MAEPFDHSDLDDEDPRDVTCKRCGQTGLSWYDVGGARWRLWDEDRDRLHVCAPSQDLSDFPNG